MSEVTHLGNRFIEKSEHGGYTKPLLNSPAYANPAKKSRLTLGSELRDAMIYYLTKEEMRIRKYMANHAIKTATIAPNMNQVILFEVLL